MIRAFEVNVGRGPLRCVAFAILRVLVKGFGDGHIRGLVLQDPVKMGYLGVMTITAHIHGEKVDKRIDTGVTLVTRENMDEPAVKDLVQPDLTRWLKQ